MEAGAAGCRGPGLALCGALMAASGRSRFLASRYQEPSVDDLFMYDCITAGKNSQEDRGEDGQRAVKTSDDILAFAFSSSGGYFALTDDNKRLVLFRTKPCWECLSVRSVVRRCTSLIITAAEDKILVADKSGDVYSYSITEPQKAGKIELGHLSLLLDVDCTLRLWEYKSGKEVHCCHLNSLNKTEATKNDKKYAVSRIAYCCQGNYIAILCDCIPTVYIFQFDAATQLLNYRHQISLKHKGWDIAFEETGGLWILQEDREASLLLYRPVDEHWQPVADDKGLMKMSKYLQDNWTMFEGSVETESYYSSLYKASFDNMAIYLQKKEERLQQQQKKRKELQHESNKQTKKIRTRESY
ncbi:tRNA (guanine-N(7)-)-methyltransferase non-catalytic subunit WDR4 isoform X3 [Gopherus flavomarginatus]|uniref:tRNA (guanine-N(7)-)-methyltransferase non-catalytic subunit WDR4 isoform X3 n=1 Tax=Gopherus flavomarginatus TaxID=286002 RepID=UPI0021CC2358|nr:tRNA (guanine-N(7)-)-methyltransferase non-catalytic subunit WDR4 isoform X3 [Gopherus flavomarginatus]